MYAYVAYGLGIHSATPLPELVPRAVAADVVIAPGEVEPLPLEAVSEDHQFWAGVGQACHVFKGIGAFWVCEGRDIIFAPAPSADERVLRLSLLGPAMALILVQRGQYVLHASAIAIAGRAVAFLGDYGWGKSTTAAALHARGHEMLTDDVTAIHMGSELPRVVPSFPQFKLWPESAAALGAPPETLPLLHPQLEKRACRVTRGFAQTPLPLECLYILDEGGALESEPCAPQEALQALMQHWYGARFGKQLLQVIDLATHFQQCVTLVNQVSVRRLHRPPCLSALPDLARFIEDDLALHV
jgi:hypothetical protein